MVLCKSKQLFAGHVVGSLPMERKNKMHRMINLGYWQACSVKSGGISAKFSFYVFMDSDGVEVHELARKNEAHIQPTWLNKPRQ